MQFWYCWSLCRWFVILLCYQWWAQEICDSRASVSLFCTVRNIIHIRVSQHAKSHISQSLLWNLLWIIRRQAHNLFVPQILYAMHCPDTRLTSWTSGPWTNQFLPRMSSVCPSVRLWHWWYVGNLGNYLHGQLAQHLRSLLPKGDPPTARRTWENFGETRGGVGKMALWRTKAAISLKRVKMEEKLLWRAYRNSPTLFRTVYTIPDPLLPPLSQDWGFAT